MTTRILTDRTTVQLGRLLRLVGHDVEQAAEGGTFEDRVLVTRDESAAGARVFVVRSHFPFHQAREVIRTLGLTFDLPTVGPHGRALREVIEALKDDPLVSGHGHDDDADEGLVTLEPLVDLHQVMELLLLRHRLALMRSEPIGALGAFERFGERMRRHVEDERTLVLPTYSEHEPADGFERGAAPDLFDNEHDKILRFLDRIEAWTARIPEEADDDDALSVACLELLDREKIFADLLEHHDSRERMFLYPALEQTLRESEKNDLLARMIGATVAPITRD